MTTINREPSTNAPAPKKKKQVSDAEFKAMMESVIGRVIVDEQEDIQLTPLQVMELLQKIDACQKGESNGK